MCNYEVQTSKKGTFKVFHHFFYLELQERGGCVGLPQGCWFSAGGVCIPPGCLFYGIIGGGGCIAM